jgi:hypothetical protein
MEILFVVVFGGVYSDDIESLVLLDGAHGMLSTFDVSFTGFSAF